MELKIPYGEVDLKKIREEGYLYIDKTMYIEKLEKNSKLIYTRPRRFGKSMLTSMLAYYYSINEAENFGKIFKGLYIYMNIRHHIKTAIMYYNLIFQECKQEQIKH